MKKTIIILIIFSLVFISFFVFKKDEEIENKNISVILETEEGNIKSKVFPSKSEYEYDKVVCENTSNNVDVTFDEEEWKLDLSVEEESIDGNFNCTVYFKEKSKIASDVIVRKYTENNNDGLIRITQSQTEQTPELTEYRYSGSNSEVKNYVNFNNELWRIIGVSPVDDGNGNYEERMKIIRNDSIGNYSWDTSATSINSGAGRNQWGAVTSHSGADLMKLLNSGPYYNRTSGTCYVGKADATKSCNFTSTGLTSSAKEMIDTVKWYTAAVPIRRVDYSPSEIYEVERGNVVGVTDVGGAITKTYNWIGKVGVIYPSDYAYTSKKCYNSNIYLSSYADCSSSSWLYDKVVDLWTITPVRYNGEDNGRIRVVYADIDSDGDGNFYNRSAYDAIGIKPTVYLKPEIEIISGDGTKDNPYNLSL